MPHIVTEQPYDGAAELIQRLGLDELLAEVRGIVTSFPLLLEERKDANGSKVLRALIDAQFRKAGGWIQKKSGGVDWIKRQAINARPRYICIGVEVQVSGRSDMLSRGPHPPSAGTSARQDRSGRTHRPERQTRSLPD